MRKDGKNYTYQTSLQLIAEHTVAVKVHVEEDDSGKGQDFEGVISSGGRSGRFARVGPQGKSAVFSWGLR